MIPVMNVQAIDWCGGGCNSSDKALILHLQLVSDLLLASEAR